MQNETLNYPSDFAKERRIALIIWPNSGTCGNLL
jgi:hypothetical protein